jgi:hypothetical protein
VNEINTPDMVGMRRPGPDDRAVLVKEPPLPLMPPRKLQPFLAPEALNLLVVDLPALDAQQFGYLVVAVAPAPISILIESKTTHRCS